MKNLMRKKVNGFTLVELIVVIAIVGVLAAVLTISVVAYVQDARRSQALSDARNINLSVTAMLTSPSRSGSPLRTALKAAGPASDFVVSYDGTGADGKDDVVVDILTEMNDLEYPNGFVIFISNDDGNPSVDVYVYAIKPDLANSQSRDVEPDGASPVDSFTSR